MKISVSAARGDEETRGDEDTRGKESSNQGVKRPGSGESEGCLPQPNSGAKELKFRPECVGIQEASGQSVPNEADTYLTLSCPS